MDKSGVELLAAYACPQTRPGDFLLQVRQSLPVDWLVIRHEPTLGIYEIIGAACNSSAVMVNSVNFSEGESCCIEDRDITHLKPIELSQHRCWEEEFEDSDRSTCH